MPSLGPGSQVYLRRSVEDLQPVVRTSRPYPLDLKDNLNISIPAVMAGLSHHYPNWKENLTTTYPALVVGEFKSVVVITNIAAESMQLNPVSVLAGVFSAVVVPTSVEIEKLESLVPQVVSGQFAKVLISYTLATEATQFNTPTIIGGRHEN